MLRRVAGLLSSLCKASPVQGIAPVLTMTSCYATKDSPGESLSNSANQHQLLPYLHSPKDKRFERLGQLERDKEVLESKLKQVTAEKDKEVLETKLKQVAAEKDKEVLEVKLKQVAAEKELQDHKLMKANSDVMRLKRILHMRGLLEHAQTELRSGLADDHFGKENPSRMEVWKAILEHESNQELLQCIMKCGRAWSSAEKAANMMAALYSHMSEHVHEFEYNGKGSDAVIIWRELVNSGQAKALMCIAARVNIAVQRGQRRQRTPRGSS